MRIAGSQTAECCRDHIAADQIGDDDRHDEVHADERGPGHDDAGGKARCHRMRRSGKAHQAFSEILERANETLAGPKVLPQFFLQRQWFSAAK